MGQALNEVNMFSEVARRCESGSFSANTRVFEAHARASRSIETQFGNAAGPQPQMPQSTPPSYTGGGGFFTPYPPAAGAGMHAPQPGFGLGGFMPQQFGAASASTAGQRLGDKDNPMYIKQETSKLAYLLPVATLALIGYLVYSNMERFNGSAKDFSSDEVDTTFHDVRGCDEAKSELQDVVEFLQSPESFNRLGGKVSTGVLLVGPPGTGKTLLAKAVAGEAGVPFFFAAGSDFEEMFVGVGASRMRNLFKHAAAQGPCIVFIDEIDAVGSKRHPMDRQSARQTINQLLVELDGFSDSNVIVIAATNAPDSLDPALTRSGRFDRRITVPLPNLDERKQILDLYLSKIIADPDLDVSAIAGMTPGASGADLANTVNMAAVLAAKNGAEFVTAAHLGEALETLEMGAVRKTFVMTPTEMRNTAYHESGHAIMAAMTPGSDPIHKATIVPRGRALGMVMQKPLTDKVSYTRQQLRAQLDILMGGRVAEEIFGGQDNVTTGASNDMMKATQIARKMVQEWGYTDAAGLVFTPLNNKSDLAPSTKALYDEEVKRILNQAHERSKKLIGSHKKEMHRLATTLLEKQTLTGEEIHELLGLEAPETAIHVVGASGNA